jgi:hypothetical protein
MQRMCVLAALLGFAGAGATACSSGHSRVGSPSDAAIAADAPEADESPATSCSQPLCEPTPPSTLLPAGTTSLPFAVTSDQPSNCAWSFSATASYVDMTPFSSGQGTTLHQTTFTGLDPSTMVVNHITVRCDAGANYVLDLKYRSLPNANPNFPRKGNLWGSWQVVEQGLPHAARIDLYNGAGFTPQEIQTLRTLNPNILITRSINSVERDTSSQAGVPDAYWLHDTTGKKIEVWPGAWRLNLTKPEVAAMQAQYAYQQLVDADFAVDGCFFDNFFTSQSWVKQDIYGNAVSVDANDDGLPDDPVWLDAAWKKGVYDELRAFRKWMPWAIVTGHLPRPPDAELGQIFNGDSFGFIVPEVREGLNPFADFWGMYQPWYTLGQKPVVTMIEAAPPMQIGYGYGYDPLNTIPASTLEFARGDWPNMRFGLGVTLMNDGYFAYEYGDTYHGNDWWYDELDFDLGQPCGAAQRVALPGAVASDHVSDGGFENAALAPWTTWVNTDVGAAATFQLESSDVAEGQQALRADVSNAGQGVDWHIAVQHRDISIVQGQSYDVVFWAKGSASQPISIGLQKQVANWDNYGLWQQVTLTPQWTKFQVTFEASVTAVDGELGFSIGAVVGTVWLDGVQITEHPADVFTRAFTNGLAVLNGTHDRQTVSVGSDLARLSGTQAPRTFLIVDDSSAAFSSTGAWQSCDYDSGDWTATGPFFHNWRPGCHELTSGTGDATWALDIRADDTYSIDAWWAAAPGQAGWTTQAVFEVMVGGAVLVTATLDQSATGDQWHHVASVALRAADQTVVRVRNAGTGTLMADALLLQSTARYNDGSAASSVDLDAMDAIVLRRTSAAGCP